MMTKKLKVAAHINKDKRALKAKQRCDIPPIGWSRYVLVRTYSAGVFAGELESRKGQEVVLRHARRIWYWAGAASLSELAMKGTSKPTECKFPVEVDKVELLQAIEILDVTPVARKSIKAVPIWTKH